MIELSASTAPQNWESLFGKRFYSIYHKKWFKILDCWYGSKAGILIKVQFDGAKVEHIMYMPKAIRNKFNIS